VEGPRIAVRAAARGTTVTGREFDNAYHFLFEVEAGRISAAWEYGDTLHADRVFRG
jgi:ketosteroid isomerase-like protein